MSAYTLNIVKGCACQHLKLSYFMGSIFSILGFSLIFVVALCTRWRHLMNKNVACWWTKAYAIILVEKFQIWNKFKICRILLCKVAPPSFIVLKFTIWSINSYDTTSGKYLEDNECNLMNHCKINYLITLQSAFFNISVSRFLLGIILLVSVKGNFKTFFIESVITLKNPGWQ